MPSICPNINWFPLNNRVEEHFSEQMGLGISAGTIYNFNVEAYDKLELFEAWLIDTWEKSHYFMLMRQELILKES